MAAAHDPRGADGPAQEGPCPRQGHPRRGDLLLDPRRRLIMGKIEKQIAALTSMSSAQLRAEWQRLIEGEPAAIPDHLMRRLVAYRIQERRHGGLPAAVLRELKRSPSEAQLNRRSIEVRPGTRFVREWNGQTISVEALEEGFIWQDRTYDSLSAIACEVTGAHWSGPRFFGLTNRG